MLNYNICELPMEGSTKACSPVHYMCRVLNMMNHSVLIGTSQFSCNTNIQVTAARGYTQTNGTWFVMQGYSHFYC